MGAERNCPTSFLLRLQRRRLPKSRDAKSDEARGDTRRSLEWWGRPAALEGKPREQRQEAADLAATSLLGALGLH